MAITIGTPDVQLPLGPKMKMIVVDITYDSSHLAAGETCDLSDYFASEVFGGFPITDTSGYQCQYDPAASNAPATGTVIAYYADYDAGADGALIDVPDTTDLSGVTGKWVFFGY